MATDVSGTTGCHSDPELRVLPGLPWPLGAHWDGHGVSFALFSEFATRVDLCLFDAAGRRETARLNLPGHTDQVWHGYLPGIAPGQTYGYRVDGPYDPDNGHRFNPHKLLLDPYAREIVGEIGAEEMRFDDERYANTQDTRDNAAGMLKGRIVDDTFDWGDDRPPRRSWADTVIYEVHVKGFTRNHPEVPEALRGTYAGLTAPAALAHLKRLGITAVNLLPVHHHLDEYRLLQLGLSNYWGYNSIGFFAPHPGYASRTSGMSTADEFRQMVKTLHAAGIEVILDVVYNHTAESDRFGPTLCFRGIDNRSYYRLVPGQLRIPENHTGCGNMLDLSHPRVLQMVMDSLRYWVTEMHVDGFRFDLAVTLAREDHGFDPRGSFLNAIRQDPALAGVKLIAEPWDIGPDGYQLGRFPPGWAEWNDRYRDSIRNFWLRRHASLGEFARRLCGSSELFEHLGRRPQAGINFITAHDGFTLHDLTSYEHKHNEANGENNRDGHNQNLSWNCGQEGKTDDAEVLERRQRVQKALLATLLISQGVPMLLGGDELGRSQCGNNNAYCQDNAMTWYDWHTADEALIAFVTQVIRLRQEFPQLRRTTWFSGRKPQEQDADILWLHPDGREMAVSDWNDPNQHAFGFLFGATAAQERVLLCLINADLTARHFVLPPGTWFLQLDSSAAESGGTCGIDRSGKINIPALALLLLSAPALSGQAERKAHAFPA